MEKARQHSVVAAALCASLLALPAAAQGLSWVYSNDARDTRLMYGEKDGDSPFLIIGCGGGRLRVIVTSLADQLSLESDFRRQTYRLKPIRPVTADEGDFVVGTSSLRDPVITSFLRTGQLKVRSPGGWLDWSANSAAERQALSKFAQACKIGV